MSFAVQPDRNRQSCQATKTLPAPSISAVGSGPLRSPPATVCDGTELIVVTFDQLPPPSVDRNAPTAVSEAVGTGTITVPVGCTTGWPPSPAALPFGLLAAPQVGPPSFEVLILIRSPRLNTSHWV